MATVTHMRALKPIIFGLEAGPGHYLDTGQTIRADLVNRHYLDQIKDGGRNSTRAELVELDAPAGTAEPVAQPQAHTAAGRTADDNNEHYDPTKHKVDEVLEYLKTAPLGEVERIKAIEAENKGAGRPSTRIANFQIGGDGS